MLDGAKLGSTLVLYAATVVGFDGDDLIIEGRGGPSYRVNGSYVIPVPDDAKVKPGDAVLTEWNGVLKHAVITKPIKDKIGVRSTDPTPAPARCSCRAASPPPRRGTLNPSISGSAHSPQNSARNDEKVDRWRPKVSACGTHRGARDGHGRHSIGQAPCTRHRSLDRCLTGAAQGRGAPVAHETSWCQLPALGHRPSFPWDRIHPFDIEHGTNTSGFVPVADLDQLKHEPARAQSLPYAGSQPSIIRAALTALQPLESFKFIDLGCGKGRPLLVASEFPFCEIIGVELSASLAKTARHNADVMMQRFSRRTPIRIVVGDVKQFPLPAGNLVLFLYNPFDEQVVAKVAEAVNTALTTAQRTVYVVYYNPVAGHCFDASPLLRRRYAATLPYAASELGYGPDTEDPIVVWQGGTVVGLNDRRANARIQIIEPRHRVRLLPV